MSIPNTLQGMQKKIKIAMNRALIFLKNSIPRFSAEVQNPVIHQLSNWECGATLHGEFLMEVKKENAEL